MVTWNRGHSLSIENIEKIKNKSWPGCGSVEIGGFNVQGYSLSHKEFKVSLHKILAQQGKGKGPGEKRGRKRRKYHHAPTPPLSNVAGILLSKGFYH